ncbi:hypothetical protein [Haloplanus halobius]|uniref:hypothetical protein n=1 Tax=Haloplanus halobius TaxID=2934938 RepID=UPI00200F993C|nr:hypothetical protein [Haloplanus sp. XH21]
MTDAADVRAALRALATDDAPDARPSTIIADAVAALDDVHAAAAFVDDGGLPRLRRAIEATDRAGDDATARRGRRALAAIERCRGAAADHFHSGHGTVLSADRQGPTE